MLPAVCLKTSNERTLFVAFDFDQCLDKIVSGDYTKNLLPFAVGLVDTHARDVKVDKVRFVTFSNRISDFYNDVVQPDKGHRPNIKALEVFASALQQVSTLTIETDLNYPLQGDGFFADQLGLSIANYEDEKLKQDRRFIAVHKEIASTTRAKEDMMERITRSSNTCDDHFLFIDDKFKNLSTEHLSDTYKRRINVLHFHATKIASPLYPNTAFKLKEPEKFAKFVIQNYLNVEDWFTFV